MQHPKALFSPDNINSERTDLIPGTNLKVHVYQIAQIFKSLSKHQIMSRILIVNRLHYKPRDALFKQIIFREE